MTFVKPHDQQPRCRNRRTRRVLINDAEVLDWVRAAQRAHARTDVHRHSAGVIAADLALAGVQAGTDLNVERLHRVANRHRAADRSLRPIEHRRKCKPGEQRDFADQRAFL
jgi:hypothetical protein